MDILPLHSIRDEDASLVGADLTNLARLAHLGLPVAKGIVVVPPEIKLKTLMEHFNFRNKEVFEQSLVIIKQEIAKITPPPELVEKLKAHKLEPDKIWHELLGIWLEEIRKRIWRDGLSKGVAANLTAQSVFFTGKINSSGKAFADPDSGEVVVEGFSGMVEVETKLALEKLVKEANKKLFIPQNYYWITEGKSAEPKFVRLVPFTQYKANSDREVKYGTLDNLVAKAAAPKEDRSVVKIFLKAPKSFELGGGDGVLINGEDQTGLDEKIHKLSETAISVSPRDVIYKLSDLEDAVGGVRGALRLNHQSKLLEEDAQAILFARNKRNLGNVSVCIPFTRSVTELLQIKRNLAALGISRKGSLKLWLELSTPENFLNLEEYLLAGVNGVVVNLDELSSWLGGFDHRIPEAVFYKRSVSAMTGFMEDGLKLLHKSKVPFIALGSLAMHDEVLAFLIEKGAYGLVVDMGNFRGLTEHLKFVERRLVSGKA